VRVVFSCVMPRSANPAKYEFVEPV